VPSFFLDTSALAKLYHKEFGSDQMERLVQQPANRSWISSLSIVEMESVLAMKVRSAQLHELGMEIARRRFRADLAQRRILVAPPFEARHLHGARRLLTQYGVAEGLRTLDALQLSIALDLQRGGLISILIAADQRLCRVAELAGCSSIDPQAPGSLVTENL
jgi:predicted nucleic acid-binding protein